MKHKIGFNRLDRRPAHRRSLVRNMITSLFQYERITTTKAKALEVRRTAEKMITRAKADSVHNRRIVGRDIHDESILAKLFTEIGPRVKDRNGGYTRILKKGPRKNDGAEMVILELVDRRVDDEKIAAKEQRRAEKKAKQAVAETEAVPANAD
jgi:large subunit ribosomal protein L17